MTIPIKIIKKEEFLKDNKNPSQKEVWDSIADNWDAYRVKEIPSVADFLNDKKGLVVDLGCGNGRNMIKKDNLKFFGIDFSGEQLKNAEKYAKNEGINAEFVKSKISNLNFFKDETFDYGLFMASLHCMDSKEERKKALKEFYRTLKQNAEALISVWNSDDKRFNGIKGDVFISWRKEGIDLMRYYYLYKKQELIDLLENSGFKILKIYEPSLHDRFSKKNWIFRIKKI